MVWILPTPQKERESVMSFSVDFTPPPAAVVTATACFVNIRSCGLCSIQRQP